jgi:hypothetical protein
MITALSVLKLGGPAATKAGSLIFQKLSRLRKINEALDSEIDDELLKKAVEDFEIVKGSWKGEFDETLDKFLRSFEATGLCEIMFNNSLVHSRNPSIKLAFLELFHSETGQSKDNGELLYNQIASSFEVSVSQLSKDPVMARMLRSSHQSLIDSITAVESALEHILYGMSGKPTHAEMSEIIPKILRSVAGDTKYIRVETSQGRKDIEINKIYISPRLKYRNPDRIKPVMASAIEQMVNETKEGIQDFTTSSNQRAQIENAVYSVNFSDILSLRRVVVLGNPGGGKSTLLQNTCYMLAVEGLKAIADGTHCGSLKVPVRIILRDFEHARAANPQLNLIDFIVNDLLMGAYSDKSVLTKAIENLLSTGQLYLAFDGLDEILKTANRRIFVDIVNKFVRQYPLCQVLVTSREVGYDNAPLSSQEYEELVLGDFIDEDVKSYSERFIRHLGQKRIAEARAASASFMMQTAQNASDLRKNPLMLGLMMWIFNIRDDVPSNRPEIYQECSRLMFERWDSERGIIAELPQTFDRLQVFSYLASKIFTDEDHSAGVSARWIEKEIKNHLSEVLESRPQAQAATASLVQFIVDRSWVMSEKGEGVFSFTHQTFLEYFFAKFNDDCFDKVDELFVSLLPHIKQDEWDVVSRLSLQIKTDRNRRRQDEAIGHLVTAMADDSFVDSERRALAGFSIRCLEFLIGSEATTRVLINSILATIQTCYRAKMVDALDYFPQLFYGANERRAFVIDAVEQWLSRSFAEGGDEDRDFVLACIDGYTSKFEAMGTAQHSCKSIPHELVTRFRGKIMPLLLIDVNTNPKMAKTLFEWTGTIPKSSLNKFGPAFIHFARPSGLVSVDGLSGLALAASGRFPHIFRDTVFTRVKAETSLKTFGNYWRRFGVDNLVPFPADRDLNNPPASVWFDLIRCLKGDADLRLGGHVAAFVEFENFQSSHDMDDDLSLMTSQFNNQIKLFRRSGDIDAALILKTLSDRLRGYAEQAKAEFEQISDDYVDVAE